VTLTLIFELITLKTFYKKRYNSGTYTLSKVKFGENYPRAKSNTQRNVRGHKVKH